MRDGMDDTTMRLMREFESAAARMERELLGSASARMARELLDSSSARMARDLANNPVAQAMKSMIAGREFPSDLLSISGAFSGASIQAIVGSMWANETVASARRAGTLNNI